MTEILDSKKLDPLVESIVEKRSEPETMPDETKDEIWERIDESLETGQSPEADESTESGAGDSGLSGTEIGTGLSSSSTLFKWAALLVGGSVAAGIYLASGGQKIEQTSSNTNETKNVRNIHNQPKPGSKTIVPSVPTEEEQTQSRSNSDKDNADSDKEMDKVRSRSSKSEKSEPSKNTPNKPQPKKEPIQDQTPDQVSESSPESKEAAARARHVDRPSDQRLDDDPSASEPEAPRWGAAPESNIDIATEHRLLDEAKSALAEDDFETTRRMLRKHRRDFPDGQLTEQRKVLKIQLLKQTGQNQKAKKRGNAFLETHPDSILTESVSRILAK